MDDGSFAWLVPTACPSIHQSHACAALGCHHGEESGLARLQRRCRHRQELDCRVSAPLDLVDLQVDLAAPEDDVLCAEIPGDLLLAEEVRAPDDIVRQVVGVGRVSVPQVGVCNARQLNGAYCDERWPCGAREAVSLSDRQQFLLCAAMAFRARLSRMAVQPESDRVHTSTGSRRSYDAAPGPRWCVVLLSLLLVRSNGEGLGPWAPPRSG